MSSDQQVFSLSGKKVWVAGDRGMVGSALVRRLQGEDCALVSSSANRVDLRRQADVEAWMGDNRPDVVLIAAAKVGGILANDTYSADFLYDNLMIEANVIKTAFDLGVQKLLLLGSSCIYPRHAPQPMTEDVLLTGPLEPTNEWYAIAKIAGIKLCQAYRRQHGSDFISAMPTNMYGPFDNYDLRNSHVIPALIRKAHMAKVSNAEEFVIWGSGTPRREFMYVDDCADALVHLVTHYSGMEHVNVGTGTDVTIEELARLVLKVVGFEGELVKDTSKPDGMPRKLLDVSRLQAAGWQPKTGLEDGLRQAYDWFLANEDAINMRWPVAA
jgi:GDP-L-fucose synthase